MPASSEERPALSWLRLRHTLQALALATALCGALILVRFGYAHVFQFAGFFWNLILAWIPLLLALAFLRLPPPRQVWRWLTATLWLLFLPNSFYIVTDLIHLKRFGGNGIPKWYDILLIGHCAVTGLLVGCTTVYLAQDYVRVRHGRTAGWIVALASLALSSIGVYLGRVFRLNSWDVVSQPMKLWRTAQTLGAPESILTLVAFSVIFFACTASAFYVFTSVTRWQRPE